MSSDNFITEHKGVELPSQQEGFDEVPLWPDSPNIKNWAIHKSGQESAATPEPYIGKPIDFSKPQSLPTKDNGENWIKAMLTSVKPEVLKLPKRHEYLPWLRIANSPELTMVRLTGLLNYLDIPVERVPLFVIDALPDMDDADVEKIAKGVASKAQVLDNIEAATKKMGVGVPGGVPSNKINDKGQESSILYGAATLHIRGLDEPLQVQGFAVTVTTKEDGITVHAECGPKDMDCKLVRLSWKQENGGLEALKRDVRSKNKRNLRILDRGMAAQNSGLRQEGIMDALANYEGTQTQGE